jgi:plasmid maintenance system antidote protein VapI
VLLWDDSSTMTQRKQTAPISDLLRRSILVAVESGETNLKALERETGVVRASIRRFVTGTQSLRLDKADRLAAHFGLELRLIRRKGRG